MVYFIIIFISLHLVQSSALSTNNKHYLNNMLSFYESIIGTIYNAIDNDFNQVADTCVLNQACKSTTDFGNIF